LFDLVTIQHGNALLVLMYSMVRPAGFEPAAPGLGILCSIRLSYGRPGFVSRVTG